MCTPLCAAWKLQRRFTSWMESTSPYTARKTPPTASMKSMAAGDENTPPAHGLNEKGMLVIDQCSGTYNRGCSACAAQFSTQHQWCQLSTL